MAIATDLSPTTARAIVVSHTHWDRAWYVPFQEFRIQLVKVVDRLLHLLDSDLEFRCFMLDGQMVVLEDYLEVRPERRVQIEELVRAGRLQIGPWYVLADEYLVSPEALVRNLLIGREMAESFGPYLNEGYIPDTFGHPSQIPQILRGFGIDSAFFMRGLGDEGEVLGSDFRWVAPDGTDVYAHWMPGGYSNVANMGHPLTWGNLTLTRFDLGSALRTIDRAIEQARPYSRTGNYLLMNGVDHAPVQAEVPQALRAANEREGGVRLEQGTLTEYKQRVLSSGVELPRHAGELRMGRYNPILQGVYSSRMYLKQANERAQRLLERYAEPLSALAHLSGADDERGVLRVAWKTLLKNHPHDDICGCSVDAVHDQMMSRFAEVEQIGGAVVRTSCRTLAASIRAKADAGTPLVVYNPLSWSRTEVVDATVYLDTDDPAAAGFTVLDEAGRPVPHQVWGEREVHWMEPLTPYRRRAVSLALPVEDVPGVGYRTYYLQPGTSGEAAEWQGGVRAVEGGMENEHLRVSINPNGTLDVEEKAEGRRYPGLHLFEDTGDAGDEYTYSPVVDGGAVTSEGSQARVTLLASGPVCARYRVELDLQLPSGLAADRRSRSAETRSVPVSSEISLYAGERAVRIRTEVDNTVPEHRLRVRFPTGAVTDLVHAGGHYDVVERPVEVPQVSGWKELPAATAHALHFVDVSDADHGLAVFNPGLPEYEAVREDGQVTLSLTLLRCTGWLSRDDILSRPGHAGPGVEAPGGQCPGRHTFEYAFMPHAGGTEQAYRAAYGYAAPMHLATRDAQISPERMRGMFEEHLRGEVEAVLDAKPGTLPETAALVSVDADGVVLTTLKTGEVDGDSLVARFFSLAPEPVEATVRTYWDLRATYRTDMGERAKEELAITDGKSVRLQVRPREVVTVLLYPAVPSS